MNPQEYNIAFENIQYAQTLFQGVNQTTFDKYIQANSWNCRPQNFFNPALKLIQDIHDDSVLHDEHLKALCDYFRFPSTDYEAFKNWMVSRALKNEVPVSKNEAQAIIQSLVLLIRNNQLPSDSLYCAQFLLPTIQEMAA